MRYLKLYENFNEPDIEDLEDIFINIIDLGFKLNGAFIGSFSKITTPILPYRQIDRDDVYDGTFKSLIIYLNDIGSLIDHDFTTELYHSIKAIESMYGYKFKTLIVGKPSVINLENWFTVTEKSDLEDLLFNFQRLYISPYRKRPLNRNLRFIFEI
jgi:hypothetical protein